MFAIYSQDCSTLAKSMQRQQQPNAAANGMTWMQQHPEQMVCLHGDMSVSCSIFCKSYTCANLCQFAAFSRRTHQDLTCACKFLQRCTNPAAKIWPM